MGHFVTLEMWAVLIAGPCIVSWIFGWIYGAACTPSRSSASISQKPESEDSAREGIPTVEYSAAEVGELRNLALAHMPPITELRAQSEEIRNNVDLWAELGVRPPQWACEGPNHVSHSRQSDDDRQSAFDFGEEGRPYSRHELTLIESRDMRVPIAPAFSPRARYSSTGLS